jgi:hypothetical protein
MDLICSYPRSISPYSVIAGDGNGTLRGVYAEYLGTLAGQPASKHPPPSLSGRHQISGLNVFYAYWALEGDDRFALSHAPTARGVVSTPHILVIRTFRVDLHPIREQDHGTGGLLVAVGHLAPVQNGEHASRPVHTDGAGIGQSLPDDQPLGGAPSSVDRVLLDLVSEPLRTGPTLPPTSAGKSQGDQPVPRWGDLLRSGDPPPLSPGHLLQGQVGLFRQPLFPDICRKSGNSFEKGQAHEMIINGL